MAGWTIAMVIINLMVRRWRSDSLLKTCQHDAHRQNEQRQRGSQLRKPKITSWHMSEGKSEQGRRRARFYESQPGWSLTACSDERLLNTTAENIQVIPLVPTMADTSRASNSMMGGFIKKIGHLVCSLRGKIWGKEKSINQISATACKA